MRDVIGKVADLLLGLHSKLLNTKLLKERLAEVVVREGTKPLCGLCTNLSTITNLLKERLAEVCNMTSD